MSENSKSVEEKTKMTEGQVGRPTERIARSPMDTQRVRAITREEIQKYKHEILNTSTARVERYMLWLLPILMVIMLLLGRLSTMVFP